MSNYYITLGISQDAEIEKIKKAYRISCKKYHPDKNPEAKNSGKFLQIREAYETLSDEEKHKNYDKELFAKEKDIRINQNWQTVKERRSFYHHDFKHFYSLVDDLFEGYLPGFFEEGLSRQKELFLELILSREEAAHGGTFPVLIPVFEPCLACQQTGVRGLTVCPGCSGYGQQKSERSFNLMVPPDVLHGSEIRITLEDIGLKDVFLNIDIIVDDVYSDITFS